MTGKREIASIIRWETPPPKIADHITKILEELKKHPGEWALIQEHSRSTSAPSQWRKFGCEAESRSNPDGSYRIYARWPEKGAENIPENIPIHDGARFQVFEKPKPKPELVEVKLNGKPTGQLIPKGSSPGGYLAGRAARNIPGQGLPASTLGGSAK
jgi:hypothetical protein